MHAAQPSSVRHPLLIPACLFFTLLPLYHFSWQFTSLRHSRNASVLSTHKVTPIWTDDWVDEWLDTQMIQPFNLSPLKTYCNATTWHENLVFNLMNANGGIGNIRGNTLDFILYAIEAGASIMLPGRASRDAEDYSNVWGGRADFDTFFDEDWFLYAMSEACPQMTIYKPTPEQMMTEPLPAVMYPRSRRTDEEQGVDRTTYRQEVQKWLGEQAGYSADKVVVINLERSLWEFDTRTLPPGLRRAVGQLLRITPSVRRLAAIAIQRMAMNSFLQIDAHRPIPPRAFFGCHLRTESDAAKAGWLEAPSTNFTAQTDAYIEMALRHKLKVLYTATGNATELARFKEKAAMHRLNVTSKYELLVEQQDIDEMADLTWDQLALIDYEILQRCSIFGGFVRSSFSYNIAITRNQVLEDQGRSDVYPWTVQHEERLIAFDDGYSRIIGRDEYHDRKIPRGMWP